MIGMCDLEYPAFSAWVQANKPAGCEVINTHQGLDWLAKHPEMLFPRNRPRLGAGSPSSSTGRNANTSRPMNWTSSSWAAAGRTETSLVAAPTFTRTERA